MPKRRATSPGRPWPTGTPSGSGERSRECWDARIAIDDREAITTALAEQRAKLYRNAAEVIIERVRPRHVVVLVHREYLRELTTSPNAAAGTCSTARARGSRPSSGSPAGDRVRRGPPAPGARLRVHRRRPRDAHVDRPAGGPAPGRRLGHDAPALGHRRRACAAPGDRDRLRRRPARGARDRAGVPHPDVGPGRVHRALPRGDASRARELPRRRRDRPRADRGAGRLWAPAAPCWGAGCRWVASCG